jgi:DNA-binding transcriptional ArsR family regulator
VASPAPAVLLPEAAGGVEVVARFFSALGDPTRLRLLEFLLGERTVTECVAQTGLSQGRGSSHLACLAGLTRSMAADNAAALAACVHIAPAPDGEAGL